MFMYRNTPKNILLQVIKLKIYNVIQKSKNLIFNYNIVLFSLKIMNKKYFQKH